MFNIKSKFELKVMDVHKYKKTQKKTHPWNESVYREDKNNWLKWSYKYADWHEASYAQIQLEAEHRRQVIAMRGY